MSNIQNPQITLESEFTKAAKPFLLYLATIIIWLSFIKDCAKVGFKWEWLAIRLGYLPFMLFAFFVGRKLSAKNKIFTEIPVMAAAVYITSFCTLFSLPTGYLSSDYLYGLIQFYIGIAIMPIRKSTFFTITFSSIAAFLIAVAAHGGSQALANRATLSNIIPLIAFSCIVYLITSKIRAFKIQYQNALADTLEKQNVVIQEQAQKLSETKNAVALAKLSSQVAHDIRSPLAALEMFTGNVDGLKEEYRVLLRSASRRIGDIANTLLETYKDPTILEKREAKISKELLPSLIDLIITEKRQQFRDHEHLIIDVNFDELSYGAFAEVDSVELKRVISNLINNAVEAIETNVGNVYVSVESREQSVHIKIRDNGKGIPQNVLPKLFSQGASFGKTQGSGLGLFHAQKTLRSWGGNIDINSTDNIGTTVTISLPKAPAPKWYLPKIEIKPTSKLVILDDDSPIHDLWKRRFAGMGLKMFHFATVSEFSSWINSQKDLTDNIFLMDYEILSSHMTGLDLILKHHLEKQAILITCRFDESHLTEACEKNGLYLVPKNQAAVVPITFTTDVSKQTGENIIGPLHVFLEDDELVRWGWSDSAKKYKINFQAYSDTNELIKQAETFPSSTVFYLDSNLGNNHTGEAIANTLADMGFSNIYLASGYMENHQARSPHFLGSVGKIPPWEKRNLSLA